MKLLLCLCLMSFVAQAQEKILSGFDPHRDLIADNYEAGEFLIYDCEEKHWTCVTRPYFDGCKEQHQISGLNSLKDNFSCVTFNEFPTKKSCFQEMLFLSSNNFGTNFCQKKQ